MSKEEKYLKWGEYYFVANQVVLGIFTLYTVLNRYIGVPTPYDGPVGSLINGTLYALSVIGFPILSFVSQFSPALGDWEVRKLGTVIFILFLALAVIIFELLRRLVRVIREKGLLQAEGVTLIGRVFAALSIAVCVQFAGTLFVGMQSVGGPFPGESIVGFYFSMILESIPFVSMLLLGGVWIIRKMYQEAVELKKDQELTV